MEKYSQFRDAATGIAPFLNNKPPSFQAGLHVHLGQIVLGICLLPPLIIAMLSYFLFLQYVPTVNRLFLKVVVLRLLRLFYVSFKYENERRTSTRKAEVRKVMPGDVILSNFLSPIDAMVYASRYKATYVFPTENGQYVELGFVAATMRALSLVPLQQSQAREIADIIAEAKRTEAVVVIFVEGTTSNGRGLLSLDHNNFRSLAQVDTTQVWTATLKYTPACASSPRPQSLLAYLWHISTNAWWYMVSVRISQEPLAKSNISAPGVSKSMCSVGRLRQLGSDFGIAKKREFNQALLARSGHRRG